MEKTKFATTVTALVMACLFAYGGTALAAKGGTPGKPDSGEEGAGNRMSYPALTFSSSAPTIAASWDVPADGTLGGNYSYGCDKGETSGSFSYPNTSCVDDLMNPSVYYTAEQCTDSTEPSPCQGYAVFRIYWQKVADNNWSADQDNIALEEPPQASVAYLDWGDALEAVSWNERSIIRVETQPYSSNIPGFDPTVDTCYDAASAAILDPDTACRVGFQMWHVSGQGTNEQWGVRADETAVSYNYDSPFQIINAGTARLNLAKMSADSAECPSPGGGDEEEVVTLAVNSAPGDFVWDATNHVWTGGEGTEDPCTWQDAPYSVELSVGGKYVYGYNWRMKSVELDSFCGSSWLKTGWWRLTFYTTDDAVLFDDAAISTSAPPAVPSEARDLETFSFNTVLAPTGEPVESDALYTPMIDVGNNLTYLDICVVGKTQGGGGGGGGGKPDRNIDGGDTYPGGGGNSGGGFAGGNSGGGGGGPNH